MKNKVLVYSAKNFEIPFLDNANKEEFDITYTQERLTSKTAMLSVGFENISIFSADDASPVVLQKLRDFGVKYITLRSAGYDNVNLKIAKKLKFKVANAPGYSPNAIAEHAIALMLALNRKLILANKQIEAHNFSLENLVGFNVHKKTAGIIGTGKIGGVLVKILHGFGCNILANDLKKDPKLETSFNIQYTTLKKVCMQADLLFVCVPLTSETHYLIHKELIDVMKPKALLVNIARGAIVNTIDILEGLNAKKIGGYATDVYENESGIFFYDHSKDKINDKLLQEVIDHSKIVLTPHQAFVTEDALTKIAETTFYNIRCWKQNTTPINELIH